MISAESMEDSAGKGKDMEDRDGEKGPMCKHGEGKNNGIWH